MPVITLVPTSTILNVSDAGGPPWAVVGGSTVHGVLSDGNNATEVNESDWFLPRARVALSAPTIPAGAKIDWVQVKTRIRSNRNGWLAGGSLATNAQLLVRVLRLNGSTLQEAWVSVTSATSSIRNSGQMTQKTGGGGDFTLEDLLSARLELVGIATIHPQGTYADATVRAQLAALDINYNERPVVGITAPSAEVTNSSRPLVEWTYSDPEGDPQESFQIIIEAGDQTANTEPGQGVAAYNSGRQYSPSARSWIPDELVSGPYTYWVRSWQAWRNDHPSLWQKKLVVINVSPPAVPEVEVTPHEDGVRNTISLSSPGTPAVADFQLQYSDDNEETWINVRGGAVIPASGPSAAIDDHEPPPNTPRLYRARSRRYDEGTGNAVSSSWSDSESSVMTVRRWWVKDVHSPSDVTMLRNAQTWQDRRRQSRGFAFYGLGRSDAIVSSAVPTNRQLHYRFLSASVEEHERLMDLLTRGTDLLLTSPREQAYVRVVDDIQESADVGRESGDYSYVEFNAVEVRRP